jgi:D-arabinose 1-dehydrogenase-like Zn-dependent alcohol dehydrogenase
VRAAVLESPGRFRIVERPLPEPAAGEVRIRIEGSGVCASDLPLFEGRDSARA